MALIAPAGVPQGRSMPGITLIKVIYKVSKFLVMALTWRKYWMAAFLLEQSWMPSRELTRQVFLT